MKLKSKRARIQTVDEDDIVTPLQAKSASVPQLGNNCLRKVVTVDIDECAGGEMAASYHSREYLRHGTSCTSWEQMPKPVPARDSDGWLDDPQIGIPLFMDMDSARSPPDCPSLDVLYLGSPLMQAISMPSSPIFSEGSWDSGFNTCYEVDDFALEVSSAEDRNTGYGELQLASQCLGSDSSLFPEMPRPLRVREPWISPLTIERNSCSMSSLFGREMYGWALPAVSPSRDVSLSPLPISSWSGGTRGALIEEDIAAESQSHCDLHRRSDILEKPICCVREGCHYRSEVNQLPPSGRLPFLPLRNFFTIYIV